MKRQEKNEARREAILDAALQVFSHKGFACARMEDIAREAEVAKGTLYLYFDDKEGLFNGLVEAVFIPVHLNARQIITDTALSLREKLLLVAAPLLEAQGHSRVARVIRLVHTEGVHHPQLLKTYSDTILTTLLTLHREHLSHSPCIPEALRQYPQLLMAPIIHGLTWQGLFGHTTPLDIQAMFTAYLDMVLGTCEETEKELSP